MSTSDDNAAHWIVIQNCFERGLIPVQTKRETETIERRKQVSRTLVYTWHKKIKDSRCNHTLIQHPFTLCLPLYLPLILTRSKNLRWSYIVRNVLGSRINKTYPKVYMYDKTIRSLSKLRKLKNLRNDYFDLNYIRKIKKNMVM